MGDAEAIKENTWAIVPTGALYQSGEWFETAANMKAKWEAMKAAEAAVVDAGHRSRNLRMKTRRIIMSKLAIAVLIALASG